MPEARITEDWEFSLAFRRFLQENVPDVDAARLLLRIAGRPDVWWEITCVCARRNGEPDLSMVEAAGHLQAFRKSGLLQAAEDGKVRYAPASEELRRHVQALSQAYEKRPVTLIRIIHALHH